MLMCPCHVEIFNERSTYRNPKSQLEKENQWISMIETKHEKMIDNQYLWQNLERFFDHFQANNTFEK